MSVPKKFLGYGGVVALIALLAAGIYFRINGNESKRENAATTTGAGEAVDVSAAEAGFDASVPISVEGVPVIKDTLILGVKAAAEAAAFRITSINAQVSGPIQSVPVRENTVVRAGSLLVGIDATEHELELKDAQAQLAQAENQYREITLWDDRIEDPQVRAAREQAARLKANLEGRQIAVQRAQMNFARTRVLAPFDGRVANLKVVPGQYVTTGTELLTVLDIDPIKVEVNVLEADVANLVPGRGAQVTFAAFPDQVFRGRIETINPVVDPRTRTARVTVYVPNPDGRILPGYYARVTLDARRMADRVLVPREAIIERDGRTLVFLFQGESTTGQAMWQYVSTGLENERYVEIIEDPEDSSTRQLKPGEIVLIDGHRTLTHAAPIRLVSDATAEGGRPR
jgi:membrane fusion protein (multidrug efflux system)